MEIWIHRDGQFAGRFSESAVREKIADGSFSAADLAWNESESAWEPISKFLESRPSPASAAETKSSDAQEKSSPAPSEPAKPEQPARSVMKPPPLPDQSPPASTPLVSAAPPPLPTRAAPPTGAPENRPPPGETIWSPYAAVLWSIFLSPAFGGFIIWRNWLKMKRRRRAMMAAPWFWLGFGVVALVFYSPNAVTLLIWIGYLLAWIVFSAFPQIRYVHTTYKEEKMRWGLPLSVGLVLALIGFTAFQISTPAKKTTLAPAPQPQQTQSPPQPTPPLSQSHDRMFTAEELRDIYKSSVLEVQATWNERKTVLNKKKNGANGTGVLLYNDEEYGLVATNWHVVAPSENMTDSYSCGVRFSHDKEFSDCLLVARAKNDVDLALLLVRLEGKWTPNQFPIRALDQIREGESCIAIGNALGEGLSVTAGIISKFDKSGEQTLIRTSTPVSPGNSGGPLILSKGGALGGIVTLQLRVTNVQNVNFATPASLLLEKDIWEFQGDQPQAQLLLERAIQQSTSNFAPKQ